ncbi:uncharacterized protein LOC141500893 [Macrotis lagotis]|uniref:uncharacterized protein LOC141500893 n=1 Tax=Macrotis lagotis TaxID=92651 RepID=UPI003D69B03F
MANKWLSMLGLLSSLQPTDSRTVPLRWKNITEATHFTYWTVIPGFPTVVPATWIGDPVELQLAGSAYLVLGGLKGAPPERKHDLKGPVTLTSVHLPICLTTGLHPLCAQVAKGTLKETPHGPGASERPDQHSQLGCGDFLHFSMIQHYMGVRLATGRSPDQDIPHSLLPPCSPSLNMFEVVQVCSTGIPVLGPDLKGTQVYFTDGGPGPYFVAPVPHVEVDNNTQVQKHLWKAAASFGDVIHATDNTVPVEANTTIKDLWAGLLWDRSYVCTEGRYSTYACNTFDTQARTTRGSDMFLVCTNTTFTWADGRYNLACQNGTMTDTLKSAYIRSSETLVFLLQIPPVTFLPVSTSTPFADSDFLRAILDREKRSAEFPVLDVIELVVSVLEQLEISALANQMHILAEDLQRFMQATAQAWSVQQQINREVQIELSALTSAVQALSTLVRTQMLLEGLPCHHVLR